MKKKFIVGIIVGVLLVGMTTVFAANSFFANKVSYEPSNTNINVKTVDEALNYLFNKIDEYHICNLVSGNELEIGSKYECNPSFDGKTKYNFYVIAKTDKSVDLIMEKNITDVYGNRKTVDWSTALNYFITGDGKNLGWKVHTDLPTTQMIAQVANAQNWNLTSSNNSNWFCLATGIKDYDSAPYCNKTEKNSWLYDYTLNCSDWGCTHSLASDAAQGYWTRDAVIVQTDSHVRAWGVHRNALMHNGYITTTSYYGIRPVITLSISQL